MILTVLTALFTALVPLSGDDTTESWVSTTGGDIVRVEYHQFVSYQRAPQVGGDDSYEEVYGSGFNTVAPEVRLVMRIVQGVFSTDVCAPGWAYIALMWVNGALDALRTAEIAELCADQWDDSGAGLSAADLGTYIRDNAQQIIEPGVLTMEPSSGQAVVNKDVYFSSSATGYEDNVLVLGVPVELEFTPVSYTWSLGDGTSFTTSSPGGPYPSGDARGMYRQAGMFTPSVQVKWDVAIRIAGAGPWYEVPGDAFTTAYGTTITAVEAEAVLVPNP